MELQKPTSVDMLQDTVKAHYDAKEQELSKAETDPSGSVGLGERDEKGQFATGNRASVGNSGGSTRHTIVDYVKAQTNSGKEMIDLFLAIMRGKEKILGQKPSLEQKRDAAKELLDRGFGKPTQQVQHSGDDTAKQLVAIRQKQLRLQEQSLTRKAVSEDDSEEVTPDVGNLVSLKRKKA